MEISIAVLFILYVILNVFVSSKINSAFYLKDERRRLHKMLIWFTPFVGPYLIKSFWLKKDNALKTITKKDRKVKMSHHSSDSGSVAPTDDGGA